MSRQLLILRHGKSDWSVGHSDFNRPLKTRGKKSIAAYGLVATAARPDSGLYPEFACSIAKNTAEIITKAMDLTTQQIHYDPQLYAANLSPLKNALALCPNDSKRVLLIGHNRNWNPY